MYRTEAGDVIGDPYIGYREVVAVVMRAEDVDSSERLRGSTVAIGMEQGHKKLMTRQDEPDRYRED